MRVLLGTRKGLLEIEGSGSSFRLVSERFRGAQVPYAMRDWRDRRTWVSVDHGHWGPKLHVVDEAGAEAEVAAPKYPEGETLADGKPATLEVVWTITAGLADRPGEMWLGTNPGGVFRGDGATWELSRALWDHPSRRTWQGGGRATPGAHSVLVDHRRPGRVLVGISVAGVFESHDAGASWSTRNQGLSAPWLPDPKAEVGHDPHLLVACPADTNVLWQQNHAGVYRSTDGGATWVSVSQEGGPVGFGFAIVADQKRPEVAWVIPANADDDRTAWKRGIVVCRTEDGGRTWVEQRAGLPQELAYDIVYRHAFDSAQGELVFGTTTGNLYWSGDGGDNWVEVGHNFPPIYSVRTA